MYNIEKHLFQLGRVFFINSRNHEFDLYRKKIEGSRKSSSIIMSSLSALHTQFFRQKKIHLEKEIFLSEYQLHCSL